MPPPPSTAPEVSTSQPSEPPAAPRLERAAFQTTEQTRTYPCGQCGSMLVFDIRRQKLACPSCGFETEIDLSALPVPAEREFSTAVREIRAFAAAGAPTIVTGEKEIVCQNCGGHTSFTGTLTAIRCPYCATPIQRDDVYDAPARLAVDGVLPFQIDQKTGTELLDKWINSRWFAPTEFKKYNETGSFTSVYAAYFTYDSETRSRYRGERGRTYTVTVGSGDNRRTETRTDWTPVRGEVANSFDDVTVLANDGFDPRRIKALEPWPTQEAKAFSPEFVAGHLSRTYDRNVEECFPEAKSEMDSVIKETVRRDIGGDQQRIHGVDTRHLTLTYKHLLLPIWLLTVIYDGRPFQVFMNGITGEVQGERPWSKAKIIALVAAIIAVIAVILIVRALVSS